MYISTCYLFQPLSNLDPFPRIFFFAKWCLPNVIWFQKRKLLLYTFPYTRTQTTNPALNESTTSICTPNTKYGIHPELMWFVGACSQLTKKPANPYMKFVFYRVNVILSFIFWTGLFKKKHSYTNCILKNAWLWIRIGWDTTHVEIGWIANKIVTFS